MDSSSKSTAIVIGASMAGLWTARALADHFDRILVLETDRLDKEVKTRPGTPQARQYHILLLRGLQTMQALFPGLDRELQAQGACTLDLTNDILMKYRGEWLNQFRSGQNLISCNRLLLEHNIRRRVGMHPNIEFMDGVEVMGLHTNLEKDAVIGVHLQHRMLTTGQASSNELHADLIVDATGRRSQTPSWLKTIGFEAPQETVVDSFLGYVTRRYHAKPGVSSSLRPLLISGTPPNEPLSGLIFPEENNNWVVMMAGVNKNYPSVEEEEFDNFAQRLGPEFYGAIQAATPLGKAYGYRGTQSRWRHYEKLERWPDRYVVLGDAFCGFNPIYGQGMTVAALCAVALAKQIAQNRGKLSGIGAESRHIFAKITKGPWLLATGADLEWPGTQGERRSGWADQIARWYLNKLLEALPRDPTIRLTFNQVNQMARPLGALFTPPMMARVLAAATKARSPVQVSCEQPKLEHSQG